MTVSNSIRIAPVQSTDIISFSNRIRGVLSTDSESSTVRILPISSIDIMSSSMRRSISINIGIRKQQITPNELSLVVSGSSPDTDWDNDFYLSDIKDEISNYWYMSETSGTSLNPEFGSETLDVVGGTVGAIPGGGGLGPDAENLSLYLNASSTYYLISSGAIGVNGDFSLWMWTNLFETVSTGMIFHWDQLTTTDHIYFRGGNSFSTGTSSVEYVFDDPSGADEGVGAFPTHTWSLIVLTRSGDEYSINYRGVPCGKISPWAARELAGNKLVIGRRFNTASNGYSGGFAHCGYMNSYVLSDDECSRIWNNGNGRFPVND